MPKHVSNNITETTQIIKACTICHVGFTDGEKPYVLTLNFGYECKNNAILIYLHCGKRGRKLTMLEKNDHVCIQFDCDIDQREGAVICHSIENFKSAVLEGRADILSTEEDRLHGLDLITQHFTKRDGPFDYDAGHLAAVHVIRVTCTEYSSKWRYQD